MSVNRDPDAVLAAWLEDGPAELPAETHQAITVAVRTLPRRRASISWPFGHGGLVRPAFDLRQLTVAIGAIVVVAVVGALIAANLRPQPFTPAATLPIAPGDWSRVVLDFSAEGGFDKIAATPRGLLAQIDVANESRFYFSADGINWTQLSADGLPRIDNPAFDSNEASMVGDDHQLLIIGREVSASEDGLNWHHLVGPAEDPELGQGAIADVVAGGPGFVAVGAHNKAWYSTDGSDWALAEVPQPPGQPERLDQPLDQSPRQGTVQMRGVAGSRGNLVAWGSQIWDHVDQSATFVPIFWASADGLTWTSVSAPGGDSQWNYYPTVAGGPDGFLVVGEDASVWFSADGRSWERLAQDAFGVSRWQVEGQGRPANNDGIDVALLRPGVASGPAGYVAAGTDGACLLSCSSEELVIWTSQDGRSWTRLSSDPLFQGTSGSEAGAGVQSITAWGDRFVVGGQVDGRPAVWISTSAPDNDNPPPPN